MALLPGGDQPILTGFLHGKTLAQESEILDVRRETQTVRHQLAMWKNYAHSLEEALNQVNVDAAGIAAVRRGLIDEGQSCPHPEHHKLSHDKRLRDQMYEKGAKAAEPIIKNPRK